MDDPLVKTIRDGLEAVWGSQGRRFLSLEWDDADGGEVFVQYLDGELNVSWEADLPLAEAAEEDGTPLPRGAFVLSENDGNTIVAVGDLRRDELAAWMTLLLRGVLGLSEPGLPDVRVLDHG